MKRRERIRTLRGTVKFPARSSGAAPNTGRRNLILDDGRINIGYRIIEFRIWNSNMTGSAGGQFEAEAHIAMGLDVTSGRSDGSDNREIAWAAYATGQPNTSGISYFELVDPDHIIVRDLNIIFPSVTNTVADSRVNYYILMEEYDITDQEAIISIIKEESQDVDN